MIPIPRDIRLLVLGVALTLAAPSSAFALRKSQEDHQRAALVTELGHPAVPAAGLEEHVPAEVPEPLHQLAEALSAHGITDLRWDFDIPQDPALLNQVTRWLQTAAPAAIAAAADQIRQRYAVPIGWGVELQPAEAASSAFLAVPPAETDQHWREFASGQNNWMEVFLSRIREAQATKVWVNARGVFYQNPRVARDEFHKLMPPDGLRQFLEDRNLELSLIIQHDDREAWNDLRWLFDPRTARWNIPLRVVVVMSPEGPRTRLSRPQGPLAHLQGYYTRPPSDRLPAQFTILSTDYRVTVPAFIRAVPAIRLDWEGPTGARRYQVNLQEFPRRHPARRFTEFLAAHQTNNVGILGGGALSLLTGAGTNDLDLVPLVEQEEMQRGFEGLGEDEEEWGLYLAALRPVVIALRRDDLVTARDIQATLTALVQGQLRFDRVSLATRGMFMMAATGAPPRADLLPARLTVEALMLRPNLRHRDTAWLYDPYGGVEDLLAQRPRIVGYRHLMVRGDFARRGAQAPVHRLFQIFRRVVSHRLNIDWEPGTSEEALIPLIHDTLGTWQEWLEGHPPGATDVEMIRAELAYLFRHVASASLEAERLLRTFGLIDDPEHPRSQPAFLSRWFGLTRGEVESLVERVANGDAATVMPDHQHPTDVPGRLDEQLSKVLHPTEVGWFHELYPHYQQERRLVGPVFHTRDEWPGRTFLVALFPYNPPESGPVLRIVIPRLLERYYADRGRVLVPEDVAARSFHEADKLPDAAIVMLRLENSQLTAEATVAVVPSQDLEVLRQAFTSVIAPYIQPTGTGLEEGQLVERLRRWEGARFLLVDDQSRNLLLSRAMLEDEFGDLGISVILDTADTFHAATALLDGPPYGVVILDYNLDQGHTGTELAAIIRARFPNTRIVLRTANTRETVRKEVPELETLLDGFFEKGTDPLDRLFQLLADLAPAAGLEEQRGTSDRAPDAFL